MTIKTAAQQRKEFLQLVTKFNVGITNGCIRDTIDTFAHGSITNMLKYCDQHDIDTIEVKSASDSTKVDDRLTKHVSKRMLSILAYEHIMEWYHGTPVGDEDAWIALDKVTINGILSSPTYKNYYRHPTTVDDIAKVDHSLGKSAAATSTPAGTTIRPRDPVTEFKKGIKRDPSSFPKLSKEEDWDDYFRSLQLEVRAQDVANVLDSKYRPGPGTDDEALFLEHQKYMFNVFNKTLLTNKGKELVRQHSDTGDAQALFTALLAHAQDSTAADINATELLTYLSSSKVDDGTWRGKVDDYILHWKEQLWLYNKIGSKPLDDEQAMVLLRNAVRGIEDLRQVQVQARAIFQANGKKQTYSEYCALLKTAATEYDSQHKTRKKHHGLRNVNVMDMDFMNDDDEEYYEPEYDLDTPIDTIVANAAARIPGSRLQRSQWRALSNDGWLTWDKLSDEDKAIILQRSSVTTSRNNSTHTGRTSRSSAPCPGTPRRPRQANVLDISVKDLIAAYTSDSLDVDGNVYDANDTKDSTAPTDTDECADDTVNPLLAHATGHKPLPPGDVRRLLGKHSKLGGSKPHSGTPIPRQANVINIVYRINLRLALTIPKVLMDRGANGPVLCGRHARLLEWTNRWVAIQGVGPDLLPKQRIGTVGGVVDTQHGEVIAIIHQAAFTEQWGAIHYLMWPHGGHAP